MGGAEGMNVKAGSRTAWRVEGRSGGRGVISQTWFLAGDGSSSSVMNLRMNTERANVIVSIALSVFIVCRIRSHEDE